MKKKIKLIFLFLIIILSNAECKNQDGPSAPEKEDFSGANGPSEPRNN